MYLWPYLNVTWAYWNFEDFICEINIKLRHIKSKCLVGLAASSSGRLSRLQLSILTLNCGNLFSSCGRTCSVFKNAIIAYFQSACHALKTCLLYTLHCRSFGNKEHHDEKQKEPQHSTSHSTFSVEVHVRRFSNVDLVFVSLKSEESFSQNLWLFL